MVKHAEADAEVRFATVLADPAFGRPTRYDEVGRIIRVEVPADPRDAKWWLSHRRPQDRGDRVIVDLEDAAAAIAEAEGLTKAEVFTEVDDILDRGQMHTDA